ncbi:MAG: helix-turn-helix domain-containing protein [Micropepsaceae bacterium]
MNERGQTFIHQGDEKAEKPFHYTQCGLDDVYLLSGFTLKETAHGPAFSIKNIEGLHAEIAFALVRDRKTFNAKEVRFMRKQMKLTQEKFGELIGVGDQMVARFEKSESSISTASAMLLRAQYLASTCPGDEQVSELKKLIADVEAHINAIAGSEVPKPIYLRSNKAAEWKVAA